MGGEQAFPRLRLPLLRMIDLVRLSLPRLLFIRQDISPPPLRQLPSLSSKDNPRKEDNTTEEVSSPRHLLL